MDPAQISSGGGTLCPRGKGSWPFCFGPEKTQKREKSSLICITNNNNKKKDKTKQTNQKKKQEKEHWRANNEIIVAFGSVGFFRCFSMQRSSEGFISTMRSHYFRKLRRSRQDKSNPSFEISQTLWHINCKKGILSYRMILLYDQSSGATKI